jgi:hypothetical protein
LPTLSLFEFTKALSMPANYVDGLRLLNINSLTPTWRLGSLPILSRQKPEDSAVCDRQGRGNKRSVSGKSHPNKAEDLPVTVTDKEYPEYNLSSLKDRDSVES